MAGSGSNGLAADFGFSVMNVIGSGDAFSSLAHALFTLPVWKPARADATANMTNARPYHRNRFSVRGRAFCGESRSEASTRFVSCAYPSSDGGSHGTSYGEEKTPTMVPWTRH